MPENIISIDEADLAPVEGEKNKLNSDSVIEHLIKTGEFLQGDAVQKLLDENHQLNEHFIDLVKALNRFLITAEDSSE